MSEPDAVPLPREGEVFFDVRGEARSMRLSWYANSSVAVFSIWQGNRCTGTFRLPFADLTRMVQALQAGPPAPPVGQDHPATSSYGQPMPADAGYGDTAAYYPGQDYSDPGYREPEYSEPQYSEPQHSEPQHSEPQYSEPQYQPAQYRDSDYSEPQFQDPRYQETRYQEPQYQEPQYREADYQQAEYSEPQYQQPEYQQPEYQEPGYQEPGYREQDYGGWGEQTYVDGGADGDSGTYGESRAGTDQPYGDHPYGQHGYQDDYSADPGYGRGRHGASDQGDPRSDLPGPGPRANYAMPDYDPPDGYGTTQHSPRTQPDLVGSQHAWSDSGWSEDPAQADPLRSRDAESVPDPAMMSFPSVPARNGPSGYR